MVQEIFKRYEKKYLLTEEEFGRLMLTIGGVLELDAFGRHQISNIYFDTPDYLLILRKAGLQGKTQAAGLWKRDPARFTGISGAEKEIRFGGLQAADPDEP